MIPADDVEAPIMPQVELLGLARHYAGVATTQLPGTTLEELLTHLCQKYPGFSARCPNGELLPTGLVLCVNERLFTQNLQQKIDETDRVLIMSADVGGT